MLSAKEVNTVLDERKLAVLRAIVEDYVSTTEPVGSKSLVDRHGLDVSPATIRNDLAVLEDQGFIAQPHTSAGRSRRSWPGPTASTRSWRGRFGCSRS